MTKYKSIPEPFAVSSSSDTEEYDDNDNFEFRKWCGIRRSTVLLVFYIVSYFSYLLLGGYVMSVLETPHEESLKARTKMLKDEFLEKNPLINRTQFEHLLQTVTESSQHGIGVLENDLNDNNWSLGQSFLFTVTVVTTVGYGHIVPLTSGGKLFCIFFAALGIPFTLVFLSASVQRLLSPTLKLLTWLMSGKLGKMMSPFGIRLIHLSFLAITFGIMFVIVPAVVFTCLEPSWAFLDGFYYVFISLTTIGLGDYIPGDSEGQKYRDVYKACVAIYLLLGIVFMSLFLTVFYDIPQLNLGFKLHTYSDIKKSKKGKKFPSYRDDISHRTRTNSQKVSKTTK